MWPQECKQESLRFDLVTYLLIQHDPYSNLALILSKQTFRPTFIKIGWQMLPLEYKQEFSKT